MASRLAKKFATNKAAETQGILYEEYDNDGPLFQVRLARIGSSNKKLKEKMAELNKPYRRMKAEDIPTAVSEKIFLQAICETVILPNTWQTFVDGKYVDGIEDPATGNLLPATAENYQKVLSQLKELLNDLVEEATNFTNYRLAAVEEEAKN